MNDTEREQWIDSDRGLNELFRSSGLSMRSFIRRNREQIDRTVAEIERNPPVESVPKTVGGLVGTWVTKLVQDVRDRYHVKLEPDEAFYAVEQLQRRLATDIVLSCASVDSNKDSRDITFVLSGTGILLVTHDLILVDLGTDGDF